MPIHSCTHTQHTQVHDFVHTHMQTYTPNHTHACTHIHTHAHARMHALYTQHTHTYMLFIYTQRHIQSQPHTHTCIPLYTLTYTQTQDFKSSPVQQLRNNWHETHCPVVTDVILFYYQTPVPGVDSQQWSHTDRQLGHLQKERVWLCHWWNR